MISRRAFLTGASSAAIAAAMPAAKAAPEWVLTDFGVEIGDRYLLPRKFGHVFWESTAGAGEGFAFAPDTAASKITWDTLRAAMDRLPDRDPNPSRRPLTVEELSWPIPMLEETPPDDGTVEWQMMYGPGDGSRPLISDFPHKLTRLIVDGKDIPIA